MDKFRDELKFTYLDTDVSTPKSGVDRNSSKVARNRIDALHVLLIQPKLAE